MGDQGNRSSSIQIQSLYFSFRETGLFQDLSTTLNKNSIYGLLGLNGAGKTTLLRLLSGLLFPDSGNISVFDHNPSHRDSGLLSRIFFIPEEFTMPPVKGDVFLKIHSSFYPQFDIPRFNSLIEEFRIPFNKNLNKLSLGEKKKYLLAFGLSSGTNLLLMDEPTNGLDIPSKSQFRKVVSEARMKDTLVIVSTHQVRDLDKLIDPIIILHKGKIILNHSLEEITEKIHMTRENEPPPVSDHVLYTEKGVGMYYSLRPGSGNSNVELDLEVLFNAVISHPDRFRDLFGVSQ